jgi:excisionase family DNA binding protein
VIDRRLLSSKEAAAYLGLGSRFAIYRLVSRGQVPAVRLANKLRLDVRDLDAMIEAAKSDDRSRDLARPIRLTALRSALRQLAPFPHRRHL